MKILPVLLTVGWLASGRFAQAEDYQGADAVLKQLEQQASGDAPAKKPSAIPAFRADLKSYGERVSTLPPDQAAGDWLALFDRALKLPPAPYSGEVPTWLAIVFQELPPPPAWDALAARVAARPMPASGLPEFATPVLRVVTDMLEGHTDSTRLAIEALGQQMADAKDFNDNGLCTLAESLPEEFVRLTKDKQGELKLFEAKVARLRSSGEASSEAAPARSGLDATLDVPDLVALAGAARATELLKQLFAAPVRALGSVDGDKTKALARQVALGMGERLKFAPWSLVDTLDATALYEALDGRFPQTAENRSERTQATAYYLLGLVSQGRAEAAGKVALKLGADSSAAEDRPAETLPEDALNDLAAKGYAKEVFQFLDHLLTAHATLPYWKDYAVAAVLAGETDAMLARTKAAGERADLQPVPQSQLQQAYADALLAADRVAEATPILRKLAAATPPETASRDPGNSTAAGLHARLLAIGRVLGDDALIKEQLDAIRQLTRTQPGEVGNVQLPTGESLADVFLAAGRGPEMEEMLAANLLNQEAKARRERERMPAAFQALPMGGWDADVLRTPLCALADFYARAGRYGDVVAMLDRSKEWGVDDVAKLAGGGVAGTDGDWAFQVARALQQTGQAEAARRLVNVYLDHHGGSDPAYALLLALLPPDRAETRLNELFQGDQFEERPLIWRASLQLGQGRLEEAERSARQAVAIDPSDGDEGPGDRLRGYAVLADILERRGDAEKAAPLRRAVKAIRLSEDADRFRAVGMITRAIAMYEEALGYFADAYCIQSRLAIQLAALGKMDDALAHYERAYELMPESFGRMESHCFGCERAFAGERAQRTAERVFQRFAEQQPGNARVHYLLGYLRGEQDRRAEAAREFREAVRLDPDYINAWKNLAQYSDDPADCDRAQLNLLRLDPLQKHESATLSEVGDLRALWTAVAAAAKFEVPPPASIYPLAASKAALDEAAKLHPLTPQQAQANELSKSILATQPSGRAGPLTPPAAILGNGIIKGALQLLRRNADGTVLGDE